MIRNGNACTTARTALTGMIPKRRVSPIARRAIGGIRLSMTAFPSILIATMGSNGMMIYTNASRYATMVITGIITNANAYRITHALKDSTGTLPKRDALLTFIGVILGNTGIMTKDLASP
jgi:hypothetical protein